MEYVRSKSFLSLDQAVLEGPEPASDTCIAGIPALHGDPFIFLGGGGIYVSPSSTQLCTALGFVPFSR